MATNPNLDTANEYREQVFNLIHRDPYGCKAHLWRTGMRDHCDAQIGFSGSTGHWTRYDFTQAFARYKTRTMVKISDLRITTDPAVLAGWAHVKINI